MAKKIKTGQEELDRLREARARAQEAYRFAREAVVGVAQSQKYSSAADAQAMVDKIKSWESQYVDPVKATRKALGSLAGGSKVDKQGQIVKTVSPGIGRYSDTGARAKLPAPLGSEARLDTGGATPKQQTSDYLMRNKTVIEGQVRAKTVGALVSKETRTLSKQLSELGKSTSLKFDMDLNKFYDVAGIAIRNPERVSANMPKVTIPRGSNTAVNPSVKPKNTTKGPAFKVGSKFEPNTGKGSVPSVFKEAFKNGGPGSLGGVSAIGALSAGIDELWMMNRGSEGSGAGGDYKTERKKK